MPNKFRFRCASAFALLCFILVATTGAKKAAAPKMAAAQIKQPAQAAVQIPATITPVPAPAGAEYRLLWVDVFHPGLRNAQEIDTMLQVARGAGYNGIIV